jgi:hypothetical protein
VTQNKVVTDWIGGPSTSGPVDRSTYAARPPGIAEFVGTAHVPVASTAREAGQKIRSSWASTMPIACCSV